MESSKKQEAETTPVKDLDSWWDKKKHSILIMAFTTLLSLIGGFWQFIQVPLQAQIVEDMKIIGEMPIVRTKLENLEGSVNDIKLDQRELRSLLNENNQLIRDILKRPSRAR